MDTVRWGILGTGGIARAYAGRDPQALLLAAYPLDARSCTQHSTTMPWVAYRR